MNTGKSASHTRLELDRDRSILVGVCAGVARWLGVDATWVRVAALVLALLATKLAVVAYLIGWLLLDE